MVPPQPVRDVERVVDRVGAGQDGLRLAEVAQERGANLCVGGTREPNVLQRLLGQSVSEAVSHKAHCDVLIVH